MQENRILSLGQEDPLEKEIATHSSILAWEMPWAEESGDLQSTGLHRVRHSLATKPPHHWLLGRELMIQEKGGILETADKLLHHQWAMVVVCLDGCMGRCKSPGSLKSFLWYAPQLSGACILCFHILRFLRAHRRRWL